MNNLTKKLDKVKSNVNFIRSYRAESGIYDCEKTLKSIVDLLEDIIKEIEKLKTVDDGHE